MNKPVTSAIELLRQHSQRLSECSLAELMKQEPQRVHKLYLQCSQLHFDFSRNHFDNKLLMALPEILSSCDFFRWRHELFNGGIVNHSENQPALHTALRPAHCPQQSAEGENIAATVDSNLEQLLNFAEMVRNGSSRNSDNKPWTHILHLGIGGSALGPQLLLDALEEYRTTGVHQPEIHILPDAEGHRLEKALKACVPATTLVIITTKSFTTSETLLCAETICNWLRANGVDNITEHLVAITSAPQKAMEWGVQAERILRLPKWIGGRYSLWSAVSLVAVIALGTEVFRRFLAGAAALDRHFLATPPNANIPIIAAVNELCYTLSGCQTTAVFPYDGRLTELVPYLQQLTMESNGKSVDRDGQAVTADTAPILWGGVGTGVQHSVFQLLHQGTHRVPCEFICVRSPNHQLTEHQNLQIVNCFAQATALMYGSGTDKTDPQQYYPGNRPSTLVLLEQLTPEALGSLIAYWEHRCFTTAMLLGINPFDQMGVELGKSLARKLSGAQAATDEIGCPATSLRLRQWNQA